MEDTRRSNFSAMMSQQRANPYKGTMGMKSSTGTLLGERQNYLSQGVKQSGQLQNSSSDYNRGTQQLLEQTKKKSMWPFGGKLKSRRHKTKRSRKHKRHTRKNRRHTRKH